MTTYVNFAPPPSAAFTFSATLDGVGYNLSCPWNHCAQRFYLLCIGAGNELVFNQPLIASPDGYDINLAWGYFQTSTLVFRASSQNFEINP